MISRHEPRSLVIQQNIEKLLQPLLAQEQVEILARIMGHIIARDTHQDQQLKILFGEAFNAEYKFLRQQHQRDAGAAGERIKRAIT
jgi:hypothetical protein